MMQTGKHIPIDPLTNHAVGPTFDFTGKRVLVTGASRGLGRAIALAYARANATLAVTARSRSDLDTLADEVESLGRPRPLVVTADQCVDEEVASACAAVIDELGGVDVLVNNAGQPTVQPFLTGSIDDFIRTVDVNLYGPVRFIYHVAPGMLRDGYGKIVNIGSVDSVVGAKNMSAYCASKGAIAQLTRALSAEWGHKGIRVNAVCPGTVRTAANEDLLDDPTILPKILRKNPIGRYAYSEEVAALVLYLSDDIADFVSGSVYLIDGGRTAV